MLQEKDVYWQNKGAGEPVNIEKVELESIVSTGSSWWIKDSELDDGPFQIISIKCYKITVDSRITCFANIAQYQNHLGHLEQFIIDCEREELMFDDLNWGTIMTEGAKNVYLDKKNKLTEK